MKKILKKYRFTIILFVSLIVGTILGLTFKEDIAVIKPLGDLFLNMMFTIVVPLVFFTISSSVASMLDLKKLGKILRTTFLVFLGTSIVAAIFMLFAVLIVNPVGSGAIELVEGTVEKVNFLEKIVAAISVSDFSSLLSRSSMLPLILFSIVFGIATSTLGNRNETLRRFLQNGSDVMMKIVKYIMYYAPIGICAYFATLIGEFGANMIESYLRSFILYTVVGILYYIIFYTIYAYIAGGKKGIRAFYKNILNPTATAIATQSSLATLPTNLEAAEKMGISKEIRDISLPIGSTMNMHGSVMGAILKIAFLFSLFGKPFVGIDTILIALLISVLSGVVMSGIPGGGLIGEMLIVSLYGFPASAFVVISTIGLIIDAPATAINVVGNPASTMLISRIVEKDKFLKNLK